MATRIPFMERTIVQHISAETGQILHQSEESEDREYAIYSVKESNNYKNKKVFVKIDKGRFVKIMLDSIDKLVSILTDGAFKLAIWLSKFATYDDNFILKDGKKVSLLDMCNGIKVSKPTIIKHTKELIEKRVVDYYICEKGKILVLNPFIAYRGKDIAKDIVDMFKDSEFNNQGENLSISKYRENK